MLAQRPPHYELRCVPCWVACPTPHAADRKQYEDSMLQAFEGEDILKARQLNNFTPLQPSKNPLAAQVWYWKCVMRPHWNKVSEEAGEAAARGQRAEPSKPTVHGPARAHARATFWCCRGLPPGDVLPAALDHDHALPLRSDTAAAPPPSDAWLRRGLGPARPWAAAR